jgi:hypothetical protein
MNRASRNKSGLVPSLTRTSADFEPALHPFARFELEIDPHGRPVELGKALNLARKGARCTFSSPSTCA